MNNQRRISPKCPKCNSINTFDIIPELPNDPEIQLGENSISDEYGTNSITIGNCKYYCVDCTHTWKKHRGKKPYKNIKKINANAGGFPGPFFEVTIDFDSMVVDHQESFSVPQMNIEEVDRNAKKETFDWFLEELYKSDFINCAE